VVVEARIPRIHPWGVSSGQFGSGVFDYQYAGGARGSYHRVLYPVFYVVFLFPWCIKHFEKAEPSAE